VKIQVKGVDFIVLYTVFFSFVGLLGYYFETGFMDWCGLGLDLGLELEGYL
jgi:hypothetical protein